MATIIRVTGINDKPRLINADQIEMICSDENNGSKIWFSNGNVIRVREAQAMIAHMINEQTAHLPHYVGR